jgi:hypothetical protein
MPDEWELLLAELKERHASDQVALVAFLEKYLDWAVAIMDPLRNRDEPMNLHRAKQLADKGQTVIDAVRRLGGYIQNPREWQRIHERTDRLEAELAHAYSLRCSAEQAKPSSAAPDDK